MSKKIYDDNGKRVLKSKWLEPTADTATRSNENERRLATRLGGKRVPRSGGKYWSARASGPTGTKITEGGDVSTKEFHIENKRTVNQSIGIKREWLDGIREAAKRVMKDPALILTFEDEDKKQSPEDWVAVPISVFERLRKSSLAHD
jgi:hypothetical protein